MGARRVQLRKTGNLVRLDVSHFVSFLIIRLCVVGPVNDERPEEMLVCLFGALLRG